MKKLHLYVRLYPNFIKKKLETQAKLQPLLLGPVFESPCINIEEAGERVVFGSDFHFLVVSYKD